MKFARVALVALLAAGVSVGAVAQWKWRDRTGVVQYSDLPPPSGTPDKDILERPDPRRATSEYPASAPAATPSAPAPRTGSDPELEARRNKAELEKANQRSAAQKAEDERIAAIRAENCKRAQTSMRTLESGVRIARSNEKGEREILDDAGRAEEAARARSIIQSDCAR